MKDVLRLKQFKIELKDEEIENRTNHYIGRMKGRKQIDETIVKI